MLQKHKGRQTAVSHSHKNRDLIFLAYAFGIILTDYVGELVWFYMSLWTVKSSSVSTFENSCYVSVASPIWTQLVLCNDMG